MDNHCVGCGLCEGLCHRSAITIKANKQGSYKFIDKKKCDNCDFCVKVCPIQEIWKQEEIRKDIEVYLGTSSDEETITRSASGGVVSEVLMHLFRTGQIEAAIVSFYDEHANIYGDIIEKEEQVLDHAGSYYHTSKQLINIKKLKKYRRVAIVGLPCHIEGVRLFLQKTRPALEIVLISLFCTVGRTYEGFRLFFTNETGFDIAEGKVKSYFSRYGKQKLIHIEDENGKIYECNDEKYKYTCDFFYANRSCLDCKKLYGLSADISVGDAWHRVRTIDGVTEKKAIIAVNSKRGKEILAEMRESLDIVKSNEPIGELIKSQKYGYSMKYKYDEKTAKKLKHLLNLKSIHNNSFLRYFLFRIRGKILYSLEQKTKENGGAER